MILSQTNLESAFKGFKAAFKDAFDGAESHASTVAMTATSATAEEEYAWLGQFPALREWIGERVIHQLRADGFKIKNRDFESTVTVRRNDMEDDKFGLYGPLFREMGRVTRQHPDTLVFKLLRDGFSLNCYDGQYFFDAEHVGWSDQDEPVAVSNVQTGSGPGWFLLDLSRSVKPIIWQERKGYDFVSMDQPGQENVFMRKEFIYGVDARVNVGFGLWQLAFGSKAALTRENYVAARNAMMAFRGDKAHLLGVKPTHLIVPPALEEDAREMLKPTLAGGESNIWANDVKLIVSPYVA